MDPTPFFCPFHKTQLDLSMFKKFSTLFVTPILVQNYFPAKSFPYGNEMRLQVALITVSVETFSQ